MPPQIDSPAELALSPEAVQVLQKIFARYRRVVVVKEFTGGLSGGQVLQVRPIKADGTPELPTVVKLATTSMIQQEWRAYQRHILNRLPHAAAASGRPTLLGPSGLGGLRYQMLGLGDHGIISLAEYLRQPDVGADQLLAVVERLLRIMDNVWGYHQAEPAFAPHSSYGVALPPDLELRPAPAPAAAPVLIAPRVLPADTPAPGQVVLVAGFAVQKVDPAARTVTLHAPPARADAPAYTVRLRLPEGAPMPSYRAQQVVDLPPAEVVANRAGRLRAEVAALGIHADDATLPFGGRARLPSPLAALPSLLARSRGANIATIHGDFNLENVLIEPQLSSISLIDFAGARRDHVLHDLLHLEAELVTHVLPELIHCHGLDPAATLAELGWRLHRALAGAPHDDGPPLAPALHKPLAALRALRRAARRYLFDPADTGEYYQGLALYLLGALRFRSLDRLPEAPLPKRVALWSAALACLWLARPDPHAPPAELSGLLARGRPPASPPAQPDLLAALPPDRIPPVGPLPPGSRMPLDRNARFVGRADQLLRLMAGLRRPGSAQAVVGLGGVGKTQLASELAHRYGRFFPGGVFWISCADPQVVASEVAACGEAGAMGLRPAFHELPLDEQVQLVQTEWRRPALRLLIFDNCEDPAILERWWPREGGCRALVTSRRAEWDAAGVAALPLDVLRRRESIELLRAHQPDADADALDGIAAELGDLPLALHLAGSYLARYRHVSDAAGYLASLRQAPLSHRSLQAGAHSPTEHHGHVARSFAFSYDRLDPSDATASLARTLLHCAACLAPGAPIPESLVRLALNAGGDAGEGVLRAGLRLGGAIDELIELGLVRAESGGALWLHRLVAAFTRERLGADLGRIQAAVERALLAEVERLNSRRDLGPMRGWLPHLRAVADAALPRADERGADLRHALGEHLHQLGDYRGARAAHEQALAIRRAVLGPGHPATARSLAQIGKALLFYGDVRESWPLFEAALAIQQPQLGDHPDTAATLNHYGFALQSQGRLAEARRSNEEALRIWQLVLGPDHPATVDTLSNLAYVDYLEGRLDESLARLERALEVQRAATGERHPETARVLTHLGELLVGRGDQQGAERVLRDSLAIQEQLLGAEHPDTARTLCYLGDARRLAGDAPGARALYERALDVFLICHGPDHYRTRRAQAQLDALR